MASSRVGEKNEHGSFVLFKGDAGKEREGESGGFAGSRLRGSQKIFSGEENRNRFGLNRRRRFVTRLLNPFQYFGGES